MKFYNSKSTGIKIPLFRYPFNRKLDDEISDAVSRVLSSKYYVLGPEVLEFESQFAAFCGVKHCISVANGTDALEIAMRAVGVERGENVLMTGNAGFYGSTAAHLIGAMPKYADISPVSMVMPREKVKEHLKGKLSAILVTHLYGQLSDIEAIVEMAEEARIPVIEDCAQAHGASSGDRQAGSFGAVGCFSFYPTKNLGAAGDGGAIVTNDDEIAAKLKQLRQYGWGTKYHNIIPGGRNSRMDEIQAAILCAKLGYLDEWNSERRSITSKYNKAFSHLPLTCPHSMDKDFVAHLYVLRVKNRDTFREYLKQYGIATDVHYPIPDHLQAVYPCEQNSGSLPVTEKTCKTVVSLPCFPGLSEEEVEYIICAVLQYFEDINI